MKIRFAHSGFAAALAVSFALGAGLAPSRADTPAETVMKREEVMKQLGGHMKAIKAFVTEGAGSAEDVARRAGEIGAVAAKIPSLFPEGTEMNGAADSKYQARPEIWLDWEKFEKSAATLGSESKALAAAANGGDKAAVTAAFQSLGKNGCSNCHESFRQKLN